MFKKYLFILFILATASGCIAKSKIQIRLMKGKQTDTINIFSVANVQIINHQIIITGSNLNSVTDLQIKEGATTTDLEVESTTNTSIVANTLSNVSFAAGKVFEFIISNADAASTFTVNFSLCDSNLGGKGFNCIMVPNDKDVLSYDALTDKWIPRNVNGLNYKAAFDASPGVDPGGAPMAGDYYIISVAGTINTVSYAVGDWIVYNADDLEWQKVSNSKDVISVFGRTGNISAREGDYNLTKMSDVDLTTVAPVLDQILKYNGTNWVPATLAAPAAAAGTAGAPGYSFSGNPNTGFFRPVANQIGFTNNGVESVRIDDLGHMGIGTQTPNTALTIKASNYTPAFPVTMDVIDNSALAQDIGGGIGFGATDGTGEKWYGSIRGGKSNAISGNYDGYLSLSTRVNGVNGMTERMRITSAGNVGIGTSDPSFGVDFRKQTLIASPSVLSDNNPFTPVEHSTGSGYSGLLNIISAGGDTQAPLHIGVAQPWSDTPGNPNYYAIITQRQNDNGFWANGARGALANGDYLPGLAFAGQTGTSANDEMKIGAAILGRVDNTVTVGNLPTALVFRTSTTNSTGLTEKLRISSTGNVGIGNPDPTAKLHVAGQIVSNQSVVASGAFVDFSTGNVQVLQAPGASAITLNNMIDGGSYTVIVTEAASRTYTFTNCTFPHFVPANDATIASSRTVYTILKTTESGSSHCYISWITGF